MDAFKTTTGRYAPSPSGVLHLGNMTTSLLTWLDARSVGGKLLLRMEDLDPERSSAAFAAQIATDLSRLGLDWDVGYPEPGYSQGERTVLYEDVFGILMRRELLYPCYCSRSERLAASAPHPGEEHRDLGCKCRYLSRLERAELEARGKRPAWKVKVPDRNISFYDGHYGRFEENLADSGDFIIKRSDGVFAYQLAVSFDDMDMGVSRVVRGRDLIGSTARQIWLITELGGKAPEYCHAPLLISGEKKMSKRSGELNMEHLLSRFSSDELIGHMARLLGLTSGVPVSAKELLNYFSWDKINKRDIMI